GINEFIEAGKIMDIETTVGLECRVSMANTPFAKRRLNNTDQTGIAYVAMHGIPHHQVETLEAFLAPYRAKRNERNRKMVANINDLFGEKILDFKEDVVPLSMHHEGGSITERHLMFALAKKLIFRYGKGKPLIKALTKNWSLSIKGKMYDWLMEVDNPYYEYDLLSFLKGAFVGKIYVDATSECPGVKDFIALADQVGAISAYAYLGDVKNSVTGDKADATFEDEYVAELFEFLKGIGFKAITYMPSRNTKEQLKVVRDLCDQYDFFQISGVDINSPRQSFECEALLNPDYSKLIYASWDIIEHENKASI
nr:PHP domain-containing protein [Vallitaleaceae bacterium]